MKGEINTMDIVKTMQMKYTIGVLIAKMRKDMGLSQEKFGKLFDRTGAIVSYWEKGLRTPGMVTYRKILDIYNAFLEAKK